MFQNNILKRMDAGEGPALAKWFSWLKGWHIPPARPWERALVRLEWRGLWGRISSRFLNIWWEEVKKMEPGTSQQYPLTGKGAQAGSVWVVEHGNTSPRQAAESGLADTQTHQWLVASAKEVDWHLQRCLPTSSVLWRKYTNIQMIKSLYKYKSF